MFRRPVTHHYHRRSPPLDIRDERNLRGGGVERRKIAYDIQYGSVPKSRGITVVRRDPLATGVVAQKRKFVGVNERGWGEKGNLQATVRQSPRPASAGSPWRD